MSAGALVCFIGMLIQAPAQAQNQLSQSVFGNGGAIAANNSNRMLGTIGQAVIGRAGSGSNTSHIGFWYQTAQLITSVEQVESELLPKEFQLEQNYPNPFNPTTTIPFALPERSSVTLKLFDLLGREVAKLVDEELQPGEYRLQFEANSLPSGVYFYRIVAQDRAGSSTRFTQVKKLMLLK